MSLSQVEQQSRTLRLDPQAATGFCIAGRGHHVNLSCGSNFSNQPGYITRCVKHVKTRIAKVMR